MNILHAHNVSNRNLDASRGVILAFKNGLFTIFSGLLGWLLTKYFWLCATLGVTCQHFPLAWTLRFAESAPHEIFPDGVPVHRALWLWPFQI